MWSSRYRPTRVEEMVGNEDARIEVVKWLKRWKVGMKPLLLIGTPGVGKTTLVKALAIQFNLDLIELNASDTRSKERLEGIIIPLLSNKGIMDRRVILFLDEVDGIYSNSDRGGLSSLLTFAKEPSIPIIMAANRENNALKELIKVCKIVKFYEIPPRLTLLYLEHVLREENVTISRGEEINIVRKSGGDMRNLLNAVNSIIALGSSGNEHKSKIPLPEAINNFFNTLDKYSALDSLSNAEGFYYDPRFNRDYEVDKLDVLFSSVINSTNDINKLATILNILSEVDIIIARMNSSKEWRMLRYIDTILAYSLFDYTRGFNYNQYNIPYTLANKIFKDGRAINKVLTELATSLHVSKRRIALMLPYIILILKNKSELLDKIDKSILESMNGVYND